MKTSFSTLLILVFSFISQPIWAGDDDEESAPIPAIYYSMPEPFTINFLRQSKQQARYLQIKVALKSYDQAIIDSAEANLPMLQDGLRTLFSEQSTESINTVAGRQALQTASLEVIKTILKEETGKDDLDAIYFTSFILQ